MLQRSWTSLLLYLGAGFFMFEAIIHGSGLAVLEHDKIFLFTHDRYIALYALTMATIMTLAATNVKRYRALFFIIMASITLGIGNAMLIEQLGGYAVSFPPALKVDGQLFNLGVGAVTWYLSIWLCFMREQYFKNK
jgi:hypothetical protein